MIKSIDEKTRLPLEIDLTGPNGNAFALIGIAKDLGKLLNKRRGAQYFDTKAIASDMMSGDYEHLLDVMEKNFGDLIVMYR